MVGLGKVGTSLGFQVLSGNRVVGEVVSLLHKEEEEEI